MVDFVAKLKDKLYERGCNRVREFCETNNVHCPEIVPIDKDHQLATIDACAWYRQNTISIKIWDCAAIGTGGAAWSYPGYVIDRTPFGVLAHELGHHIDREWSETKYSYSGNYSKDLQNLTQEKPITGYCPNHAEWFAEIFRLFVTNPSLLRNLRPITYKQIRLRLKPVETRQWATVLARAPDRTVAMARKKIDDARASR